MKIFIFTVGLLLSNAMVLAQNEIFSEKSEDESSLTESQIEVAEDDVVELGPIVTTGTRLLRETYESISPVQVITAEEARAVGQFSAADILQNSPAATGQQIDLSFTGFALENGPGSQTLSFRGLGANRTLIMINGRRLGASGGEGAPIAPDLNMIPGGLVERYELLLDGASSIYGSDAVAGVANAILRNDFNGLEVDFSTTIPDQANGVEERLGLTWGKNYERGFIGVGLELSNTEEIKVKDRSWTNHCPMNIRVDADGSINHFDGTSNQIGFGDCAATNPLRLVARVDLFEADFPIFGSVGGSFYYLPGFHPIGIDNFTPALDQLLAYSPFSYNTNASLFGEIKTQHAMSYGEYNIDGEYNLTPFFEILYGRRDTYQDTGFEQLFSRVPSNNPYVCNPLGLDGPNCLNIGSFIRPVLAIEGDRDQVSSTVEQTRLVLGVKGDIPQLNINGMSNWNFETHITYSKSDALMVRPGIRSDRINYSLQTSRFDPITGQIICGNNDGCVPINLFSPSLYQLPIGNFATQAERDYAFGNRIINTEVEQSVLSAFINGYLHELPTGPIVAGFGFEVRKDSINSVSNDVARDGLFFNFPLDVGSVGSKITREVFAEIEFPLLKKIKGVEELTLNLSGRLTKDELYPSNDTYSIKIGYRPVSSLFLKATVGTSYRAPNIREVFLGGQNEFILAADICGGINNDCTEFLGTEFITANTFGSDELLEEKANTLTYGFAWEVPETDNYNIVVGATYYQMKVGDTVIKPTAGYIVNECLLSLDRSSPFCNRISRGTQTESNTLVNTDFINRTNQTVKGVDVNLDLDTNIYFFNKSIDIGLSMSMNHTKESSETVISDSDNIIFRDHNGDFGFPNWAGNMTLWTKINDYKFTWQSQYMGRVRQDLSNLEDFSNEEFRKVGFAGSYTYHTASIYYENSNWTIGFGIRNVFNKAPPQVDPTAVPSSVANVPLGVGYDLNGRRYFLNIKRHF